MKVTYNPYLKEKATELRKNSTLGEILLWKKLKGKQCHGFDFHRQKPINNYIVDFYCNKLNLVIEVDGYSHNFKFEEDRKRDAQLKELGFTVLRFKESEVMKSINEVMRIILTFIENQTTHPLIPS